VGVKKAEFQFDLAKLRALLDKEAWEDTDDPSLRARCVGLGSIMAITPSGKVYTPFACSNVRECPVCQGREKIPPRDPKLFRKLRKKVEKLGARCMKLGWQIASPTRAHHHATLDRLSNMTRCPRCLGVGSAEARDDEDWQENAEKALETIGASIQESEGDGAYLVAIEYTDVVDGEEEG
jgi:hypothetical protein